VRETYELEAREIRIEGHAVLRDASRGAHPRRRIAPGRAGRRNGAARLGLARAAWTRHTRDIAGRRTARYPLLGARSRLSGSTPPDRFLRDDLAALLETGCGLVGLEREESGDLPGADR